MKRNIIFPLFLFAIFILFSLLGCSGGMEDFEKGTNALSRGEYDLSIELLSKAIKSGQLSSKVHSYAYGNRGLAWAEKGAFDKAIADQTKAIEINPKFAFGYSNRGLAWEEKGAFDKAIADHKKAIEIDLKFSEGYNNLSWLLATCPDAEYRNGVTAVIFAQKAVAIP